MEALQAFLQAHHIRLQDVKPHGALYNNAAENAETAQAAAQIILNLNLCYVNLAEQKGETMRRNSEK